MQRQNITLYTGFKKHLSIVEKEAVFDTCQGCFISHVLMVLEPSCPKPALLALEVAANHKYFFTSWADTSAD